MNLQYDVGVAAYLSGIVVCRHIPYTAYSPVMMELWMKMSEFDSVNHNS